MKTVPGLIPAEVAARALPYVIGLLAVVLAFVGFRQHERALGARDVLLKQNQVVIDSLNKRLPAQRAAFAVETVTVFRRIATTDTLLQRVIDSVHIHHTDTVTVKVSVLEQADSTIRACAMSLRDCASLRTQEQRRGDLLEKQVTLLKASQPSLAGGVLRGLLWGAAGYGLGRISR